MPGRAQRHRGRQAGRGVYLRVVGVVSMQRIVSIQRIAALAIILLTSASSIAGAQGPPISHGIDSAGLRVLRSVQSVSAARKQRESIETSTRQRHTLKGIIIGGVVGVGVGAILGSQLGTGCPASAGLSGDSGCSESSKRRSLIAWGVLTGGLLGAATGGLVGLLVPADHR